MCAGAAFARGGWADWAGDSRNWFCSVREKEGEDWLPGPISPASVV
ncbi:hypothetical protein [Thauera sp. SDU_THAU2]